MKPNHLIDPAEISAGAEFYADLAAAPKVAIADIQCGAITGTFIPARSLAITPLTGFGIGEAVAAMKRGQRVRRAGWNGKGMFLFLVAGSTFKVNRPPLLGIYAEGTEIRYHAHVDMKTATGEVVPWLCSQSDLLAEDWEIVEDGQVAEPAPEKPLITAGAVTGLKIDAARLSIDDIEGVTEKVRKEVQAALTKASLPGGLLARQSEREWELAK